MRRVMIAPPGTRIGDPGWVDAPPGFTYGFDNHGGAWPELSVQVDGALISNGQQASAPMGARVKEIYAQDRAEPALRDAVIQHHLEGLTRMWQAQLGITVDGVWGPVTQAAYNQRIAENAEVERHYPAVELRVQDRAEPVGLVTGGKVTFSPAGPRGTAHRHEYVPVNLLLTGEHVADLCRGCDESVSLLPEPRGPACPQEKPVVVYQLLTVVWNSLVRLVGDLWYGLVSGLRHLTGGQ